MNLLVRCGRIKCGHLGSFAPIVWLFLFGFVPVTDAAEYDPMAVFSADPRSPVDVSIRDDRRDREIPIRVYLPKSVDSAPLILFSHGLGGSRRGGRYLGNHWSARGYVVVALQHIGSDESVWKGVPAGQRFSAMKSAASLQNNAARLRDVPVVLDQLTDWNQTRSHRFYHCFDVSKVGVSGHSFGAVTAQGVGGQTPPLIGNRFVDSRIGAAVMLSPSFRGRSDPSRTFGNVQIPWLLITGTKDTSPIGDTDVENRRKVYASLPDTIDKYELVLHEAEHFAFADEQQQWREQQRDPNHHQSILAVTTAFWDSHLRCDANARRWLHGRGMRTVLQPRDQWQMQLAKP